MFRAFADSIRCAAAGICCLVMAGCGAHSLDLALNFSGVCAVPQNGALFFQLESLPGTDGGGATQICELCMPSPAALASASDVLAFLRAQAPSCPAISPSSQLRVTVRGYASSCDATPLFCATQSLAVPGGTSDAQLTVTLACDATCSGSSACVPAVCNNNGVQSCGDFGDGCGGQLSCGTCTSPEKCGGAGGHGTPNVCSK
jgi:hypothetical protein